MNDSGTSAEPPPRLHRIATLKNFLPLSEDTRAQALPAVMPNSLSRSRPWGRRDSFGSDDPPRRDAGEGEPLRRVPSMGGWDVVDEARERRMSHAASILGTPQMRSQRLIGNSNPRYKWEQYFKSDEELKSLSKPVRSYYKRNNYLIRHYMYIDRLLDSSLPHNLIQEYQHSNAPSAVTGSNQPAVPATIAEEPSAVEPRHVNGVTYGSTENGSANGSVHKVKRTPKDIYRIAKETEHTESSPLLQDLGNKDDIEAGNTLLDLEPDEDTDSGAPIVKIALWVNTVANFVLLIMKIVVVALSSSVSVLASLVDAALDFLCTTIIWITTYLIANNDQYAYPVGRRRLEPVGVLIFAVIMITSFAQVALEGISKLSGPDHTIVRLTPAAIAIMAATVVVKGLCWLWCRLIKNGAVQALAQDAMTDVIFNTFSIIFPLVGYYAGVWWLDPLGGVLLSIYVVTNWGATGLGHVRNLTGCTATADERNVLLYLTMRFAKTIKQIQGLQAYHTGDKLNVEVDLVLDEATTLRDSHDLGESLQYVLESVPSVDRAFVHLDYASYNLPSHMQQDS